MRSISYNWSCSSLGFVSGMSIITFLKVCKSSEQLKQVHASIIYRGLEQNHFLISLFIPLSHALSTLSYTSSIFLRVLTPSTFLWNTLIKSHCHNSCFCQTLTAFASMKAHGVLPDTFTYPSVIKAGCVVCMPREGKSLHGSAFRCGVHRDLYVATSLVDMYGKFGQIADARRVFDGICKRSVVSWTAMLVGYVSVGDVVEAKKLFNEMPQRNVASWNAMLQGFIKLRNLSGARDVFEAMPEKNVVSFTIMIDGYAKVGDMVAARFLFDRAPRKDVVAWSALILGYVQNGQPNQALKVFFEMESMNVKPDKFILVSLMSASAQLGHLELAQWVDSYVNKSCIDVQQDHVIAALLDMNAKCGNIDRALKLFEERPKRDLVLYCSMIQGLSVHGCGEQAVNLFNRMLMEGLYPDEVAFIVILTACSHAGLVDEGCNYFQSMKQKYDISPSSDHYACMVDLLSRSGHIRDAYELLKLMPEPHVGALVALLGACKLYGDSEVGEIVANLLSQFDNLNAANYVLMSDNYATNGRWIDVSRVRSMMRERRVRKIPGCSKI